MRFINIIISICSCSAFNLDPHHSVVLDDPSKTGHSLFGYSVAFWQESSNRNTTCWLLVGAPKATFGTLYKCSPKNGQCSEFEEIKPATRELRRYDTTDSWFGATVAVENRTDGAVLVCAPNLLFFKDELSMPGACFFWKKGLQGSQLPKFQRGYNEYSQVGFSAHFIQGSSSTEKNLLVGAPGAKISGIYSSGRADSYFLSSLRSTWRVDPVTLENKYLQSNGYFGYAVSSGRFHQDKDVISYVVSRPRGVWDVNKAGTVFVYRDSDDLEILHGTQIGEFFGYCLLVMDLNNDGQDDLLVVGSPTFHNPMGNDEGKIYIFKNKGNATFEVPEKNLMFMGSNVNGARFGTSLAVAGDLNLDGFNDVAVGAPFEQGSGAVYIYHGTRDGLKHPYSQRVAASEISPLLAGFGFSITGGLDVDGNSVSDLAVGSVKSNQAVMLMSYPIVHIEGSLTPSVTKLNISATNFTVKACLYYTSRVKNLINVAAKVKFEVDFENKRAYYETSDSRCRVNPCIIELYHDFQQCVDFVVHLVEDLPHYETPIDMALKFELDKSPLFQDYPEFCKTCPVTDPDEFSHISSIVKFDHGCRQENRCRSDLRVEVVTLHAGELILGKDKNLTFEVTVFNKQDEDPAYSVKLNLTLPRGVAFIKTDSSCQQSLLNDSVSVCTMRNLGDHNYKDKTQFVVDLSILTPHQTQLVFQVSVDSSSEEVNPDDNIYPINVTMNLQADVHIIGGIKADKKKIGENAVEEISHSYKILNFGPSVVRNAASRFVLPVDALINGQNMSLVASIRVQATKNQKPINVCTSDDFDLGGNEENTLQQSDIRMEKFRSRWSPDADDVSNVNDTSDSAQNTGHSTLVNCSDLAQRCVTVVCRIGELMPDTDSVDVVLYMGINVTVFNMLPELRTNISTDGEVFNEESSIYLSSSRSYHSASRYTELKGEPVETVPLWTYVLAIALGLILLTLAMKLLSRSGFFKRSEKEKLLAMKQTLAEEEFSPGSSAETS